MNQKMCIKCGRIKSLNMFYKNILVPGGHENKCKECRTLKMRQKYYKLTPSDRKRRRLYAMEYYYKNPEMMRIQNAKTKAKLRKELLETYGGIPPKCACCKEKHIEFLELDHINGGGTKERIKYGAGTGLYCFLRKNKYPKGYRILCSNCNQAIGKYGKCPHNKLKI